MQEKKKATTKDAINKNVQKEFSKEQILTSEKFRNRRDLVDALLNDKKKYTIEKVDELINKFMKGQVK